MISQTIDWTNRWLGGFCAVGILGGLPIRGPDYAAHPPLAQTLGLPPAQANERCTLADAHTAWSRALGGAPVVLVRSVERARALVLQAAGIGAGDRIGLPANASRSLVEAIKRRGARPHFLDLTPHLALDVDPTRLADVRAVWAQPVGGLATPAVLPAVPLWCDCSDTLPQVAFPETPGWPPAGPPAVMLFALHLAADASQAGALLVFADAELSERVQALVQWSDEPEPSRALAQCYRLTGTDDIAGQEGLAARQQAALTEVWQGLTAAAGLPLLPLPTTGGLAHGVAVQIPEVCDVATFYAYIRGEATPVMWLPDLRPLHYAALRPGGAPAPLTTAAHLARWLVVPVGPDYTAEEMTHATLGIVKTADYLGIRWYTDPERAAWYAALMEEWYGPEHDAYQPTFPLEALAQ